jgi:hypothetical protein
MVSVEIIKDLFHAEYKNGKIFPLIAILTKELLALAHFVLQGFLNALLDVLVNSLLENLVKLRRQIVFVTQLHDAGVSPHVLLRILLQFSCVQKVE